MTGKPTENRLLIHEDHRIIGVNVLLISLSIFFFSTAGLNLLYLHKPK